MGRSQVQKVGVDADNEQARIGLPRLRIGREGCGKKRTGIQGGELRGYTRIARNERKQYA